MGKTKVDRSFKKRLFPSLFLVGAFSFLTSFSFAPYRLSYLAFFSLVPLFYFIQKAAKTREAWLYGFLAGLSFFLYHLEWLSVFGWLPWVALAFYQSLFWGLAAVLMKRALENKLLWLLPFLWVGVEFFRSAGSAGFSWGLLGLGQTNSFLNLVFPLLGVWGPSFLLVSFNLAIAQFFLKGDFKKIALIIFSLSLLAISIPGFVKDSSFSPSGSSSMEAVLLQTAVPQSEKISEEADFLFRKSLSLLEGSFLKKGSLIVFPETAYPYSLSEAPELRERLMSLAKEKNIWILVGAFRQEKRKTFNSAFLFSPEGKMSIYDKVHLVPFGEYWPFRPYLSWLPYATLIKEDLSAGSEPGIFLFKKEFIGVGICFESSDPLLIWKLVRKGAKVLVFITNDSWFDGTDALAQHFQIAQVRAAETGRLVLQVANTGYTGVISENGVILAQAEVGEPFVLKKQTRYEARETFFVRLGYLFPLVSSFLTFIFFLHQIFLTFFSRFS